MAIFLGGTCFSLRFFLANFIQHCTSGVYIGVKIFPRLWHAMSKELMVLNLALWEILQVASVAHCANQLPREGETFSSWMWRGASTESSCQKGLQSVREFGANVGTSRSTDLQIFFDPFYMTVSSHLDEYLSAFTVQIEVPEVSQKFEAMFSMLHATFRLLLNLYASYEFLPFR